MLVDLLLYGTVGWGAAVVARRAFPDFSLSSFIPSKTLKGSPEDIEPSAIAANLYLTKVIKAIREEGSMYISQNSADCFEYKKNDDKIRLYTTGYFEDGGQIRPGKLLLSLRFNGHYIHEEFEPRSKTSEDLHKTVRSIQALVKEYGKQKAKEAANAAAFKVIEALSPKPETQSPVRDEMPETPSLLTSLPR